MARLRLHRRRHRLGRARASRRGSTRSPTSSVLALEAGGEPYPENVTNPALWYTLFGTPIDWGYLSRAAEGARRAADLRAPREDAGRVEQPLHHDAHPRPRLGLRQLGLQRLPGLELRRVPLVLPEAGGPGGRHEPDRRQGRPDPRLERGPARPEPDLAGVPRRVRRARLPVHRRLQRPEHGGRRLAPHQRQGRQALLDEGGLPRPGVLPREPDRRASTRRRRG